MKGCSYTVSIFRDFSEGPWDSYSNPFVKDPSLMPAMIAIALLFIFHAMMFFF